MLNRSAFSSLEDAVKYYTQFGPFAFHALVYEDVDGLYIALKMFCGLQVHPEK